MYVHHLRLDLPSDHVLTRIVFGNEKYGFFTSKNFKVSNRQVDLDFIPPGYEWSIKFYGIATTPNGEASIFLGQWSGKNPTPVELKVFEGNRTSGLISIPFFLLAGKWEDRGYAFMNVPLPNPRSIWRKLKSQSEFYGSVFPYILNNNGEIIWFVPPSRFVGLRNGSTSIVKYEGQGHFSMSLGDYFEPFDFSQFNELGEMDRHFSDERQILETRLHHDYFNTNSDTLYFLSSSIRNFPDKSDPSKQVEYRGDLIQKLNLKTKELGTVWDSFDYFKPSDQFEKVRPDALEFEEFSFSKSNVVDFTHSNSLQFIPRIGVLVSMRNLNKVALLSSDLSKLIWTVGNQEDDSFQIRPPFELYGQHHATITEEGTMLIFNNGRKKSEVLELDISKPKEAAVKMSFSLPDATHSRRWGAAYATSKDRIVGEFFSDYYFDFSKVTLAEFDRNTGKMLASMELFKWVSNAIARVEPMNQLGDATYIGHSL